MQVDQPEAAAGVAKLVLAFADLEAYRLYFRGKDEIAPLYFMTTEGNNIPYLEDNFYSFDLKDIRVSGAHSGEFIDRDLNKLSYVQC